MSLGLAAILQLLPALRSVPRHADTRILLLGAQDLAFTYEQAVNFLVRHDLPIIPVPLKERRTTTSFGILDANQWQRYRNFVHQQTFYGLLGFSPEQIHTLDVSDFENADIIHDLNLPLTTGLGPYDLVMNVGTLEHVFDVRQALWTLSDITKVGGQIVHGAPAGFLNHGFYNFNAGLFSDFYEQSGWHREELYYCLTPKVAEIDQLVAYLKIDADKINSAPRGYDISVFARYTKTPHAKNVLATQQFYREMHAHWEGRRRQENEHAAEAAQVNDRRSWLFDMMTKRATEKTIEDLSRLPGELVVAVTAPDDTSTPTLDVELDMSMAELENGFSWRIDLPHQPSGDGMGTQRSSEILLLEDGEMLGPAHSIHADIRSGGAGLYSHWGRSLYFSTSDNSSPRVNGRTYVIRMPLAFSGTAV